MEGQVRRGYEKNGDIYVEVLLGESGYINDNDVGFTPEILEQWHKNGSWQGKVQNVHPSHNHPLVYEPKMPVDAPIPDQLNHYISKSVKYGFGTFVKTKLESSPTGNKRLWGIFRIQDEGAKQAWREGKFPRFSSSSVLITGRDSKGLVTSGYPIASSSVDKPAFPVDIAKIKNECEGGPECVTKLAESGCFCKHTVLTSFENNFSSQYALGLFENSMTDDSKSGSLDSKSEGEVKEGNTGIKKISEEITNADGTKTETIKKEEEKVDWESKFKDLEKEHKKTLKAKEEYESETNRKFDKIFKEKLEGNIRSKLEKVPLFAFDDKEENREEEVSKLMKLYPKLSEEEILGIAEEKYKLAPKIVEVSKRRGKVGESGLISNDGKLIVEKSDVPDKALILHAHEVFG